MFSIFARGLVARFAGYGCIALGFWLLYRGFSDENTGAAIGWGIGGAASILVGLYLAVSLARRDSPPTSPQPGYPRPNCRRRLLQLIPSMEATKAVNYHRNDSLVVSTSSALREWSAVSQRRDLDVDLTDCMDRAPAVGLGLSLARPDLKVLVLDCDATLRTDLSSMATIGESSPENIVHFVFDDINNVSTGGLPIQGKDRVNLTSMAQSAGYAATYEFDTLEEFLIGMEEVMVQHGPVFVLVKVFRDLEELPFPDRPMAEGWAKVKETLKQ